MVICSLDAWKRSSERKETRIEKEIVDVLEEDRKVKDRNYQILGFDLVFVG